MPRYEAALFDAGDTLLDFAATGDRVTRLVYEHTGLHIPAAEARPFFDAAFHYALGGSGNGLLWVNDAATERRYWAQYFEGWLEAAGIAARPALVAELVADTLKIEIYEAFPDAQPALQALRAAGVRIVLISNAFPSMQRIMQHLNLEQYFDECLYSCHVGYEKPAAEIFHLALSRIGLPATAACFVDDLPRNVEAAAALGIDGFLIDRLSRHPHSPLRKLATLKDLPGHLRI